MWTVCSKWSSVVDIYHGYTLKKIAALFTENQKNYYTYFIVIFTVYRILHEKYRKIMKISLLH